MLDPLDRLDFIDALEYAIQKFIATDAEVVCIDSKKEGEMVNAVIVVRGKGITADVVKHLHKLMDTIDKQKAKVKK